LNLPALSLIKKASAFARDARPHGFNF